jgi:hypothetical protein
VCVYVNVYACMWIYANVCKHMCMYVMNRYACTRKCVRVCVNVCVLQMHDVQGQSSCVDKAQGTDTSTGAVSCVCVCVNVCVLQMHEVQGQSTGVARDETSICLSVSW